ncbi:MAG: tripartite tricarboxylate transporter substrate binding protein, partial [Betaproteobacteria bacterium]|nr:tripartite tricarboxylate transporter substrate binding protein [Betaproteobacteria bacterium]
MGLILFAASGALLAQAYPAKPVRVISSGVGGGADISARLLAPGLSEALGQQLVIDNRASGVIPGEVAARTAPDGYSLLFYNNT